MIYCKQMKILLCLALMMSFSTYAQQDAEHCLGEAVESAISLKIDQLADGDCSSLDRDKYRDIEETRQNKRRFFKNAIKGLNSGLKISSRLFSDLDDPAREVQLDKTNLCEYVQKTSVKAVKEIMKDCPGGAELFQWIIGRQQDPEKISDISLAHACERVQKLKADACRESKIVYFDANSAAKAEPEKKVVPALRGSSGPAAGARVKSQ